VMYVSIYVWVSDGVHSNVWLCTHVSAHRHRKPFVFCWSVMGDSSHSHNPTSGVSNEPVSTVM
jgi:hypothetical protein